MSAENSSNDLDEVSFLLCPDGFYYFIFFVSQIVKYFRYVPFVIFYVDPATLLSQW